MTKLSDYVLQTLREYGVRHIFMLPGGGAMHLNDSLGSSGIPYTCNLHEQACAIAAEAFAKTSQTLGVTMVTSGPGGTNAVTGVAGAWLDSTPCLFLSGQVKRPDLKGTSGVRQMGVQEVDIISIVESITKYAVTVTEPESVRYHLEKALHLATTGRPGPVWLDFPLDVQAVMIDPQSLRGYKVEEAHSPSDAALEAIARRCLELFNAAERPVILAGNGVRLAGAVAEFLRVVEMLDAPVLTTWLAGGYLDETHPLFAGRPGGMAPRGANFALQNADFLLNIGSRLDFTITGHAPHRFAREARKVVVDIDQTEIDKLEMDVELSVCADARRFLRALLNQHERMAERDRGAWKARCSDWRERYPLVDPQTREVENGVSTYRLAEVIAQEAPADTAICSGSSGTAVEIFTYAFLPRAGQRLVQTTALGAMGFGLPAAIGVCIAHDCKLTLCVDGDGGFQMNIQELETVARLELPIKFFIVNNGGYASIRNSQRGYFGTDRLVGADPASGLTLPDITKVAAAYGIRAERIETQHDLAARVRSILTEPGPCIYEVMAPDDEQRMPRIASAQRADGSMVSKPLEDLWPFLDREEFLHNMIVAVVDE